MVAAMATVGWLEIVALWTRTTNLGMATRPKPAAPAIASRVAVGTSVASRPRSYFAPTLTPTCHSAASPQSAARGPHSHGVTLKVARG